MTEKKPKKEKLEIQTRVPQKRAGIFDNLGKGKQQNVKHPLSEIINFPTETISGPDLKISDVGEKLSRTPKHDYLGHPNKKNSGVLTPETLPRTSETMPNSDTQTPELLISDVREKEKSVRRGYDSSYEEKRKHSTSIDRMNLRPQASIGKRIRVFCAEQGIELTEFFQLAAINYIENFGHPSSEISDTKTPLDDRRLRLLYKTQPSIINIYLQYNSVFNPKTKWSVKDDDAASKFNECDLRLIELGIIQTQGNKNFAGKINSFGYYAHEIQSFIDLNLPSESVQTMLEINRKRWQMATGKSIKD